MTAKLIDGKAISKALKADVRLATDALAARGARRPGLAVVLVGADPASAIYVRNKRISCEEAGVISVSHDLPAETPEATLLALIDQLNADPAIDGILVQSPLPKHISEHAVIERIDPLGHFQCARGSVAFSLACIVEKSCVVIGVGQVNRVGLE